MYGNEIGFGTDGNETITDGIHPGFSAGDDEQEEIIDFGEIILAKPINIFGSNDDDNLFDIFPSHKFFDTSEPNGFPFEVHKGLFSDGIAVTALGESGTFPGGCENEGEGGGGHGL